MCTLVMFSDVKGLLLASFNHVFEQAVIAALRTCICVSNLYYGLK